jgi:WD40 repeat protein
MCQFTCFTGTTVQILTSYSAAPALDNTLRSWDPMRLCFTYSLLLYWYKSTSTDSAAAALDNTLRSWDPMSLSCSFVLKEAGESEMSCFGVLPRMRAIVTGNDDGSLRLWDLASGKHSICQVSLYRSTNRDLATSSCFVPAACHRY